MMLLKAPPPTAIFLRNGKNFSGSPSSVSVPLAIVCAAAVKGKSRRITGVVFEEVKKEFNRVKKKKRKQSLDESESESESGINKQINVEYDASHFYHAMYAYFDRDNVALKGLAKFSKESSEKKRNHAEKFMEYQNKRGWKVDLSDPNFNKVIQCFPPIGEKMTPFDYAKEGDALYAMKIALSWEKLLYHGLILVHEVANETNDVQLADFVESKFLGEQVEAIKKIYEYVAQLKRVGKGHGLWQFDQMLLNEGAAV